MYLKNIINYGSFISAAGRGREARVLLIQRYVQLSTLPRGGGREGGRASERAIAGDAMPMLIGEKLRIS